MRFCTVCEIAELVAGRSKQKFMALLILCVGVLNQNYRVDLAKGVGRYLANMRHLVLVLELPARWVPVLARGLNRAGSR